MKYILALIVMTALAAAQTPDYGRTFRSVVSGPTISITPQLYGAVGDGTTDDTVAMQAFAAALKVSHARGFLPRGKYKISYVDFGSSVAGTGTNSGLFLEGEGTGDYNGSVFYCRTANTVCLDFSGAAYFKLANFSVKGGTSSAVDAPTVSMLFGKVNNSGIVFSGIGVVDNVNVSGWSQYPIYDQSAEQITFENCACVNQAAGSSCAVLSRANTAGITSPSRTLLSPGDSMTTVDWIGAKTLFSVFGTRAILIDNGALGVGSFAVRDAYANLNGATSTFFEDTGSGSVGQVKLDNMRWEGNGGAGTNVVLKSSSNYTHLDVSGAFSGGMAQSSALFQFNSITLYDSTFNVDPRETAAEPATLISGVVTPRGVAVKTRGLLATVPWSSGTYSIHAADGAKERITDLSVDGLVRPQSISGSSAAPTLSGCGIGAIGANSNNIVGYFVSATTGACTVTLTWGNSVAYAHQANCAVSNQTTGNLYRQTGATATTVVFGGTTANGDVIVYGPCAGW